MISLSPLTYDPGGSLVIQELPTSDLYSITRRVSRRMLLDGSVSIYDAGLSDGDRTLNVSARATKTQVHRASELQRIYNRMTISAPNGVFIGLIQTVAYDAPNLTLTLMIEKRI